MKKIKIKRPNELTEKAFKITFGIYDNTIIRKRGFDPIFALEYIYGFLLKKATTLNQPFNKVDLCERELNLIYRLIRLDNQLNKRIKKSYE